ncbi:hypothetical protein WA538_003005, partial [Blastocystis sp. DL]
MLSRALSAQLRSSASRRIPFLFHRTFGSLVIGHLAQNGLTKNTLSAIQLATAFGDVSLWLCGNALDANTCTKATEHVPVKTVYYSNLTDPSSILPENRCRVLQSLQKQHAFDLMCGCATVDCKSLLARFAATEDVPMLSDVVRMIDKKTFQRPIYAGNAVETLQITAKPLILTVRCSAHITPSPVANSRPAVSPLEIPADARYAKLQAVHETKSSRPELTTASRVVVGGRGVGSKKQFDEVFALADKLGAAVGGTRAAVDMEMVDASLQVGQTGKVVAPALYVGLGVSGSIQHQAGMKDAQTIVCVNKDPEAPLFSIADYGLVADLHAVVPELLSKL